MNSDYLNCDKILKEIDKDTQDLEDWWYYNIRIHEVIEEEL